MKVIVITEAQWKLVTEACLDKLKLASQETISSDKPTLSFSTVNHHVVKMLDDLKNSAL